MPKKDERKIELVCSCGYKAAKKEELVLKEKVTLKKKDQISQMIEEQPNKENYQSRLKISKNKISEILI